MPKAPGPFDYVFIVAFFVVGNGLVLRAARTRAARAGDTLGIWYYITAAPLFWFFSWSSWQWLSDMTANNLWPLALVMFAIPTVICWAILGLLVRRAATRTRR
jgi:hypothetical protein